MALDLQVECGGKVLVVSVSGRLAKVDYERMVPEVDRLITEHGKIRILFEMHDFHGWKASALWQDTKFALRHFRDIERLAVIGETRWQKGMATFCKPFTSATVRYFDHSQAQEARDWVEQMVEEPHLV